jgi:uncharacterized protein
MRASRGRDYSRIGDAVKRQSGKRAVLADLADNPARKNSQRIAVTGRNSRFPAMTTGEVAAVALVAGKPALLFCDLLGESGLHFLSVPLDSAVKAGYMPARLTAADYPALISFNQPVETAAVSTVLAVADLEAGSERYRNVGNFVEAFFGGFQSLLQPGRHPKWRQVDITGELPGWRCLPPAAQWIQRNGRVGHRGGLSGAEGEFLAFYGRA